MAMKNRIKVEEEKMGQTLNTFFSFALSEHQFSRAVMQPPYCHVFRDSRPAENSSESHVERGNVTRILAYPAICPEIETDHLHYIGSTYD
jgi:hypothetical protein